MKRPRSDTGLNLLIFFGILIMSSGIILHLALPEKYEHIEILPLIVGAALAYFGALWKDPDRAERAGRAVTHAGDEVVESVTKLRTGKRSTDPVVEVTKTHPSDDPDAQPTVEVKVTNPGASSTPTKDGE